MVNTRNYGGGYGGGGYGHGGGGGYGHGGGGKDFISINNRAKGLHFQVVVADAEVEDMEAVTREVEDMVVGDTEVVTGMANTVDEKK